MSAGAAQHLHPSLERRQLVWWAGGGASKLLDGLDREAVGTVALGLSEAPRNGRFVARVRRHLGLGLMLDGEAWRAQLPADHPRRTPSFHALDWVDATSVHRPADWSVRTAEDFAEVYVDRQAAAATLLTTPAHHDREPVGPLRRRDVELAAMCADHVRARALREPHPDDLHRHRRELFANLLLRAGALARPSIDWLAAAYSSLDVDGYLMWAVDFTGSATQATRLLALADALQERTGRPVVLAGIGHLWQAALARGVAGAMTGARSALVWPDESLRRPEPNADEDEDGFGVAVYHGAVLSCARIGSKGDDLRRQLFLRHPCPCGHHEPSTPPVDQPAIRAHNLWWVMRSARSACAGSPGLAVAQLARRADSAAERRRRLGMRVLPTGWRVLQPGDGQSRADTG